MGHNLSKLQYLNVSFCRDITDNGLEKLVEQISGLLKIDMQNTQITNRMKQNIIHTLNCRKIYNIMLD